jgi:hypothetical protein
MECVMRLASLLSIQARFWNLTAPTSKRTGGGFGNLPVSGNENLVQVENWREDQEDNKQDFMSFNTTEEE